MSTEVKISIAFVLGVLLLIVSLVYTNWYFPSAQTHLLNWGKQVCIDIKPSQSFRSHMTCKDL